MEDMLELGEVWLIAGIVQVLSEYPLLPAYIVIQLMKIATTAVNGNHLTLRQVQYNTTTKNRKYNSEGRRYANGFSQQNIPRWMRQTVLPVSSFEIDIVNCYPTILWGLCENSVPCDTLVRCISSRDDVIAEISRQLRVKKDIAKELVLVTINGRQWRFYLAKKQGIEINTIPRCNVLDGLYTDVQLIHNQIKLGNYFKNIRQEVKDAHPGQSEARYDNLAFALVLERSERIVIDHVIELCSTKYAMKASCLLHDGFIVGESITDGDYIVPNVHDPLRIPIPEIEGFLSEQCSKFVGFAVNIKVKKISRDVDGDNDIPNPGYYGTEFTNVRRCRDRYVSVPVFGEGERCIAIKAGMRAGKTTALRKFLETSVTSQQRVLMTTGRIQQALSLIGGLASYDEGTGQRTSKLTASDGQPFKIFFYKDKEETLCLDEPGLYICQWESLHCLVSSYPGKYKTFDYVISDEIRATLNQSCVHVTNKDFLRLNMHIFRDVCTKSKCIFLDADLLVDGMVERFSLKRLGGIWTDTEIRVDIYNYQSMERRLVITDDTLLFVDNLTDRLREAKEFRESTGKSRPVFVSCRSKRGMSDLLVLLTGQTRPDFLRDGVAYFSSESNDVQMSAWEDIDNFLGNNPVDIILTTSKVTVCADMNNPVTACFILGNSKGGCHVRDLFQTIGRARQPVTTDIMTLITTPSSSDVQDPTFIDIKEAMVVDGRLRKQYIQIIQNEIGFDPEDENGFNRLVVNRSPDWMVHLACDTELEVQRNRPGMFHATLLRTANYKGWTISFVRKSEPEGQGNDKQENPMADAHKISGKELEERDKLLLEDLKSLGIPELTILAATKSKGGEMKERVLTASFLVRFPDFLEHITLPMKKYYISNHQVFDRIRLFENTEEELKSGDFKRTLFVFTKKLMERTPIMFKAIEALCRVLMEDVGLDFGCDFLTAPVEEPDHKKRDFSDYYIDKSELEPKYASIRNHLDTIQQYLGIKRSMKVTEYKDKAEGSVKMLNKILQFFGRKVESCKDRTKGDTLDRRAYRVVQDINFHQLSPYYVPKENSVQYKQPQDLAAVIRRAKKDNPDLLKLKPKPIVEAVKSVKATTKKQRGVKRSKPTNNKKEAEEERKKRREGIERVDVADWHPETSTGLSQELLDLLATQD